MKTCPAERMALIHELLKLNLMRKTKYRLICYIKLGQKQSKSLKAQIIILKQFQFWIIAKEIKILHPRNNKSEHKSHRNIESIIPQKIIQK